MWCEKLGNGKVRYCERFENPITGKTCRVSVTMDKDTKSNSKKAQNVLQSKINEKLDKLAFPTQNEEITLNKLVEMYLLELKSRVKLSTYNRNKGATNSIVKILGGDVLVNRLNAFYVKKCLAEQNEKPGTTNERIVRFKTLIRWGYENDLINNISWLDKLKSSENEERATKLESKYMESEELKELLDNMAVLKWRYLTEFTALSGLRCGEAMALLSSDVDLEKRMIYIDKTKDPNSTLVTTTKTSTSTRDIYIQDELLQLCKEIKEYMEEERKETMCNSEYFLSDINGEPLKYYAFNKYLRENSLRVLGKEVTTHYLRHTHVALMAEQGVPLDVISRRLGHSDSDITKRIYFHVTEKLRERDHEAIRGIHLL